MELKSVAFLSNLNPRELDRVQDVVRDRRFAAGDTVVAVAADLHHLHVVRSGRVRVAADGDVRSADEVLVTLGPGECFGEFSYADRKPASASIVADEDTVTWEIAYVDLDRLIESDAALGRKLLRGLLEMVVSRLRSTDAELFLTRYILRYV